MRSADWKFEQAEREVAPILAAAASLDQSIYEVFPRNIEELLAVPLPSLALRREANLCDLLDVAAPVDAVVQDLRHEARVGGHGVLHQLP